MTAPNANSRKKIRRRTRRGHPLVPVAGKVEPKIAAAVRSRAEAEGVTRSEWVARAVRERLDRAA